MKKLLLICIMLAFTIPANAEKATTYTVDVGFSIVYPQKDYVNPNNQMVGLGIRHYFNENLYVMGKLTTWNSGDQDFTGGTIITASVGGRTSGKYFLDSSLGIGYLDNPDGKEVEDGYLTGHKQFEFNLGGGYKINKETTILVGITHFSNCAKVCNLSDSHKPNPGRDFLRIGFEHAF